MDFRFITILAVLVNGCSGFERLNSATKTTNKASIQNVPNVGSTTTTSDIVSKYAKMTATINVSTHVDETTPSMHAKMMLNNPETVQNLNKTVFYVSETVLLLPLWESVIVLCFVERYFMSILVLQSS